MLNPLPLGMLQPLQHSLDATLSLFQSAVRLIRGMAMRLPLVEDGM
jgi:hypothetical protein